MHHQHCEHLIGMPKSTQDCMPVKMTHENPCVMLNCKVHPGHGVCTNMYMYMHLYNLMHKYMYMDSFMQHCSR